LDTEKRPRKSWVVWGEGGKFPQVIVEILSDSTATVDCTKKKELYQDTFRTPNYFWFDPNTLEFQGFKLEGNQYEAIKPNAQGWLWSDQLGLYLGVFAGKLRYFTPTRELVPLPQEAAIAAVLEKEQALVDKEQALAEKERLAAKLRALGINPDD
jgi:hypothetical protein